MEGGATNTIYIEVYLRLVHVKEPLNIDISHSKRETGEKKKAIAYVKERIFSQKCASPLPTPLLNKTYVFLFLLKKKDGLSLAVDQMAFF